MSIASAMNWVVGWWFVMSTGHRSRGSLADGAKREACHQVPLQDEREEELAPGEDEDEQGGRAQAGADHRQDHVPQRAQPRRAVDQRRVFQLLRHIVKET